MISTNSEPRPVGAFVRGSGGVTIRNYPSCPKYSLSDCDLMAYGGKVQEWLSSQKVNPIEVLQVGTELFQMMTEHDFHG